MKIIFRWYGKKDVIPLKHIAQIPNIYGVVSALDIPVGKVWPLDELIELKKYVNSYNLELDVIESVNVHENIKLGCPDRDDYINNYIKTMENLAQIGIKVVCYNFMPVFDWTRTNLKTQLKDGSTTLSFNHEEITNTSPKKLFDTITNNSEITMPGWDVERLRDLEHTITKYKDINKDKLRENLAYFLTRIIPIAEKYNINMALHPDDPPFEIFGLPKIASTIEDLQYILDIIPTKNNGLTLCSGSLAPNNNNDIIKIIQQFSKDNKIHFAHIRNIKKTNAKSFYESSHYSKDGDLDIYKIIKTYYDNGYAGYIRPDHGRMIWDESGMPGYGLYDRALGITYFNGLIEAIEKQQ